MKEYTYLDHAATSPLLPEVKAAMIEAIDADFGNASALHQAGHRAKLKTEEARAEVAKLINADPSEIIFTSGGSEANNTVTNIFAGQTIAVSAIEHPSLLESAKAHADHFIELPVDERGMVQLGALMTSARPNLLSIMLANNETGVLVGDIVSSETPASSPSLRVSLAHILPVGKMSSSKTTSPTYLHSDCTQALGKLPIDVKKLNVDYLTISAHKIGGPTGIGALYVKKGAPYKPLLLGGHQESRRRAGTSNILGIIGFGTAAKLTRERQTWQIYEQKIRPLRDQLARRILADVPYSSLNTPLGCSLPNILNVSFQAAEGESIQLYLDLENIAVSTGSACAAGDAKPSHVLMATRHDAEVAHSSVRFSLGLDTTKEDVDRVLAVLPGIVRRLQGISTIKIKEQPL